MKKYSSILVKCTVWENVAWFCENFHVFLHFSIFCFVFSNSECKRDLKFSQKIVGKGQKRDKKNLIFLFLIKFYQCDDLSEISHLFSIFTKVAANLHHRQAHKQTSRETVDGRICRTSFGFVCSLLIWREMRTIFTFILIVFPLFFFIHSYTLFLIAKIEELLEM